MEKYVLVTFPEIHDFMVHKRQGECIFCQEITGHPCPDSAYMVPEDLYNEVRLIPDYVSENLGKTFRVEGREAILVGYNCDNEYCIVGLEDSYDGWSTLDKEDMILLFKDNIDSYLYIDFEKLIES